MFVWRAALRAEPLDHEPTQAGQARLRLAADALSEEKLKPIPPLHERDAVALEAREDRVGVESDDE
jgi:hypothetical protein